MVEARRRHQIDVGDIDLDGHADLFIIAGDGLFFRGRGDGTFEDGYAIDAPCTAWTSPSTEVRMTHDHLYALCDQRVHALVLGFFAAPYWVPALSSKVERAVFGNFDGDPYPDLASVSPAHTIIAHGTTSSIAREPSHRGTAFFVATESSELAQEAPALGGSFFTHFLVSGLRGAADANTDGVITLAEAQSYATHETTRATASWARAAQHPNYDFEFTGHGDVVLTDLREASAVLMLDPELEGHVAITETGANLAVIEVDKRAGAALPLALPNGRYVVHLRGDSDVQVAEVVLPWGGTRRLSADELSARSYQTVSQKGGVVEVYANRVELGVTLQSAIVRGMGLVPVFRASYGRRLGAVELGARLLVSRSRIRTVDTDVDTFALGGGLFLGYERPIGLVDLRGWIVAEAQAWQQDIALAPARASAIAGVGAGAGLRVPLWNQTFAELDVETLTYALELEGDGPTLRPTVSVSAGLGQHF